MGYSSSVIVEHINFSLFNEIQMIDKKKLSIYIYIGTHRHHMNLNNGDKQITSEHLTFDWWHPECIATCFIIVTIVEIHRPILDVCVCLHKILF